jgi:hypothetical protein
VLVLFQQPAIAKPVSKPIPRLIPMPVSPRRTEPIIVRFWRFIGRLF